MDQFLKLRNADQKTDVNGFVRLYALNTLLPNQDTLQSVLALRSDIDIVQNFRDCVLYCDLGIDKKHLQLIDWLLLFEFLNDLVQQYQA